LRSAKPLAVNTKDASKVIPKAFFSSFLAINLFCVEKCIKSPK